MNELTELLAAPAPLAVFIAYVHLFLRPLLARLADERLELDTARNALLVEIRDGRSTVPVVNNNHQAG